MATFDAVAANTGVSGGRSEPVDYAHLARYTFGNKALELEVLTLFAEQAPDYLTAMREARSEKEWRDAAHTLKGSARAVGALRVAEFAEYAEALRNAPQGGARQAVLARLAEALDEATDHIARIGRAR
ncbi:MAG: Hpt domain-containing protein [Hyphomicrobiaceae bacterium]